MIFPFRVHWDKLLLTGVLMALVAAGGWLRHQHASLRRRMSGATAVAWVGIDYTPPPAAAPPAKTVVWSEPRAQSPGEGWRYELFGPPDITLDAERRAFVLRPNGAKPAPPENDVGTPTLVEVFPEPFRAQLVGSIGEGPARQVILINRATNETILARENQRLEPLALRVKSVRPTKQTVCDDGFGAVDEAAAAVLWDEQNDEEVVLHSGVQRLTGRLGAVLRWEKNRMELNEGTVFPVEDWVCRVERIQMNPDEVTITRTKRGLPAPESWILRTNRAAARGPQMSRPDASPINDQRIATQLP